LGAFGGGIFESGFGGVERIDEMIAVMDAFSTSYAQARVKFLEAAATAGLQFESFNLSPQSQDNVILALDAVFQKPKIPEKGASGTVDKLLVVSSASKSGDSFGGSGVQVFVLHDAEWMEKVRAAGVSVLYLHGSDQSLADVVKKHVSAAKRVVLVDISTSNSLKDTVFESLEVAKLDDKCQFIAVNPIALGAPAWEGQSISQSRQALFKALDTLSQ
jgi:hypothetical protein